MTVTYLVLIFGVAYITAQNMDPQNQELSSEHRQKRSPRDPIPGDYDEPASRPKRCVPKPYGLSKLKLNDVVHPMDVHPIDGKPGKLSNKGYGHQPQKQKVCMIVPHEEYCINQGGPIGHRPHGYSREGH